jgi:hypothetical protein
MTALQWSEALRPRVDTSFHNDTSPFDNRLIESLRRLQTQCLYKEAHPTPRTPPSAPNPHWRLSFAVAAQGEWANRPTSLRFFAFLNCCADIRSVDLSGFLLLQNRLIDGVGEFITESTVRNACTITRTQKQIHRKWCDEEYRNLEGKWNARWGLCHKNDRDPAALAEKAEVLIANVISRTWLKMRKAGKHGNTKTAGHNKPRWRSIPYGQDWRNANLSFTRARTKWFI